MLHRVGTLLFVLLVVLGQRGALSLNDTALPAPISVSSSEKWDGNYGQWSTFWINIGTPAQSMRLLPSTSGNEIWPILPQGCDSSNASDCSNMRGAIFNPNASSSWTPAGLFGLDLPEEDPLGYDGNSASYGFDNVTFGFPIDALPAALHQTVGGIATTDFYLGAFGLSPRSINLSTANDPKASLLATLKKQGVIPSLSWGYTAGASYRQPTAFGSLTLGGFDESRCAPNNVSFPFGPDSSRDLLVSLESISVNNASLLTTEIFVFLDSLVPDLWLPVETCKAFEKTFRLTYNISSNHYTVDERTRLDLLNRNATVKFNFTVPGSATDVVSITMQYASFDLIDKINGNNSTRSFPLRQAQNATQYTLGRTFFQNAYVTADYERSHFHISQATFPDLSTKQKLAAIFPPSNNISDSQNTSINRNAIPGIVGGVTCFLIGVIVLSIFVWRKSHSARSKVIISKEPFQKPELSGNAVIRSELSEGPLKHEISEEAEIRRPLEMEHVERHEIESSFNGGELPSSECATELPPSHSE